MKLLAILASLLVVPFSSAAHCEGPTSSPALIDAAGMYVTCAGGVFGAVLYQCDFYHGGLWIYEESNGIPGLQRGDEVVDDTCHDQIAADTVVF